MSKAQDSIVHEIESYFKQQNLVALATSDGDQPRVRMVSLIRLGDGFYVLTGAGLTQRR